MRVEIHQYPGAPTPTMVVRPETESEELAMSLLVGSDEFMLMLGTSTGIYSRRVFEHKYNLRYES